MGWQDAPIVGGDKPAWAAAPIVGDKPGSTWDMLKDEALTSLPGGLARGLKDVVDTGAEYLASGYDKLTGGDQLTLSNLVTGERPGEAARIRSMNEAGNAEFSGAQQRAGAGGSDVARIGGNILATLPFVNALGAGATAAGMTRLGNAITSGGFSTGAPVRAGFVPKALDMAIRAGGGGAAGYTAAGLVDPDAAPAGGWIGAVLPPAAKLAGAVGSAATSFVRPFFNKGQDKIVGDALRRFAASPDEAIRNMRAVQQTGEFIPGSTPTAVAAAGDDGLAGLSRTLQSSDPRYSNELAARLSAQNAARANALGGVAGNKGKIDIAKTARDEVTGPMRETVLDAAAMLDAAPIIRRLDAMMRDPNNAGKLSQQALQSVKSQIAGKPGPHGGAPIGGFVDEGGKISARALYAIRKDINDVLSGKLQGEAGNLRYASGQLVGVKGLIDDAIDKASRAVQQSAGREVVPFGANIGRAGAQGAYGSQAPRASWKQYLERYAQESIPINQMEKLQGLMKSIGTGSVDKAGNPILSAAKLNNVLRDSAQVRDLQKVLSVDQMDLVRRLSADLNAGQLSATSGKAIGSNTVQNLSGVNALNSLVGRTLGGSMPMQATLGRAVNWAYKKPDQEILTKLANSLLDPQEALRLMSPPMKRGLLGEPEALGLLTRGAYRTLPLLPAQ